MARERLVIGDSMRAITIHALSLALGGLLALVAFLALGAAPAPPPGQSFRIEYGPLPKDMVRLSGSYVVPPGKVFVLTGAGRVGGGAGPEVRVDGTVELLLTSIAQWGDADATLLLIPANFVVGSGSTIEIGSSSTPADPNARGLGFLANS